MNININTQDEYLKTRITNLRKEGIDVTECLEFALKEGFEVLETQRTLKACSSETFYKLLAVSHLNKEEYTLLQEFILRHKTRDYVCDMLHISKSTFRNIKNLALLKVKFTFDEMVKHFG